MPDSRTQSRQLERRVAVIAVVTGVTLMGVKMFAYILTGSAAIFSDAMESIVNIVASGVALYALGVAHRPADENHPYGHGRIEFLSASLEGGMICAAAGAIVVKALHDLRSPDLRLDNLPLAIAIMIVSIVANGGVGLAMMRTGRRAGSAILVADGHHLITDAATSAAALVAIAIVHFTGWQRADPIAALLMAAYLVFTGGRMLKASLDMLMDKQDPADHAMLAALLDAHVGGDLDTGGGPSPAGMTICGYHKLRHRHVGRDHWVDFHITVPAALDIRRAHEIASAIEHEMETRLGHADATAHIEPCTEPDCTSCARFRP